MQRIYPEPPGMQEMTLLEMQRFCEEQEQWDKWPKTKAYLLGKVQIVPVL